jgi:hypothetical protein
MVRLIPLALSTCWARNENWTCLTVNRADTGYTANLMPQASHPRLEGAGAVGAVVGGRQAVAGQEEEVVDLIMGG